jgi:hypothetical protein
MDIPDIGKPTTQQRLTISCDINVVTNVRGDFLTTMIGSVLTDYLRALFSQWNVEQSRFDPQRYVVLVSAIGPALANRARWYKDETGDDVPLPLTGDEEAAYLAAMEQTRRKLRESEYERIDDPYDGESVMQYERDHEDDWRHEREPGW